MMGAGIFMLFGLTAVDYGASRPDALCHLISGIDIHLRCVCACTFVDVLLQMASSYSACHVFQQDT